jgi:hypothetical protein
MDPRIGPIQGVQPKPKPIPTINGNNKLFEYSILKFPKLLFKKFILISSNKYIPKKIIITPDPMDKIFEFCNKKLPIKVAVAPREINTNEKPREKDKDFFKIKFLDFKSSSLSVVPQINETYPGIKGSTQGDTKLIKPAKKAIERDTTI